MRLLTTALGCWRRLGSGLLLGVLMLGLGVQGLSQAVERIAAPAHRHVPRSAATETPRIAPMAAKTPAAARDDHRRIPWIGAGSAGLAAAGDPALAAVLDAHGPDAHAHGGVASHRHALTDAGWVYVDADEDMSGAHTAGAAAWPLPFGPPRVFGPGGGHAAWGAAAGWHALALTGEPLDRPPR